jgi:hypothetical protein
VADWLKPNLDAIPAELRDHTRWLTWRDRNDKKVPCAPHDPLRSADPNNPNSWGDFEAAVRACVSTKATGIGYALGQNGDGPPYAGIDIDRCREPKTGVIEPWALEVVKYFDSYTEISPSGTGLKIFVRGSLPDGAKAGKRHKLEMYDRDRYFTVTGHHLDGTPREIHVREEQFRNVHGVAWSADLFKIVKLFGLYLREEPEWVFIKCPWHHEHTTASSDRDAALHRSKGRIDGFKCFHGHCQSRTLGDVRKLFGLKDSLQAEHDHRAIKLTYADTITPKPVKWLWEGRLASGTLTLLAGREGIGKTTCAYTLVADVTRGRLAGTCAGQPKKVIVAAGEDSWEHTIVPRLMAAEADLSCVARVDVVTSDGVPSMPSLPRDVEALAATVTAEGAALILLDPLISRLDSKLDTHKDAEVRQALEPLVKLADDTGAVVLGIIHVNKGSSKDPLNTVMGSRAFTAVARAVLFVAEDPESDTGRVLGQVKNNLGRSDLPTLTFEIDNTLVANTTDGDIYTGKLRWTGETEQTIRDVVEAAASGGDKTRTKDAAQWLKQFLTQHHGVAQSSLIKKAGGDAGHSESTLKRARRQVGVTTESTKTFPRITFWLLPGVEVDLCALAAASAEEEMWARDDGTRGM